MQYRRPQIAMNEALMVTDCRSKGVQRAFVDVETENVP